MPELDPRIVKINPDGSYVYRDAAFPICTDSEDLGNFSPGCNNYEGDLITLYSTLSGGTRVDLVREHQKYEVFRGGLKGSTDITFRDIVARCGSTPKFVSRRNKAYGIRAIACQGPLNADIVSILHGGSTVPLPKGETTGFTRLCDWYLHSSIVVLFLPVKGRYKGVEYAWIQLSDGYGSWQDYLGVPGSVSRLLKHFYRCLFFNEGDPDYLIYDWNIEPL